MIFFIDIIILLFVIIFCLSKVINSTPSTEFIKLLSMFAALAGALFLYPDFLKGIMVNFLSELLDINKSIIDVDFFYMLSFFIQFSVIYYLVYFLIKKVDNSIKFIFKSNALITRINLILLSIIRSFLILFMFIYALESFPFYIKESKDKLESSLTYNAFSKISRRIIQ